jgi:cyclopropane-fatty-acyl-phospholipid synthase
VYAGSGVPERVVPLDPGDMRMPRPKFRATVTTADNPARPPAFPLRADTPSLHDAGRAFGVEQQVLLRLLGALGHPPVRFVFWDGSEVGGAGQPAVARVVIHDRGALWRLVLDPELSFGDAYCDGRIDVEGNMVALLEAVYRAMAAGADRHSVYQRWLRRHNRPRSNTPAASQSHIHRHYDIGNDFYRLWLDDAMVYTCAYFIAPDVSLEQAQIDKMHHVCRKLRLRPGERVVEAGCGWGALALFMARHYGVSVRAYNISHAQIAYARERARAEGLEQVVEFVEDDYRNIDGRYDAFVSVGMLEHVGADRYAQLGRVIDACLTDDGRGLLHSIGRNKPEPINAWIQKRIFPGGYPPTLREMLAVVEPAEFSVLDVENLRLHYARTLEHWLWRYEKAIGQVRSMFDEAFVRSWRLYLAGSLAAFATGNLQLFQVSFARRHNNDIPWTRAHLYADDHERTR